MCEDRRVRKCRLTFEEQASLLIARGLAVQDPDDCIRYLGRVNYYRLSGYARYLQVNPRKGDNDFLPGSTLEQLQLLYALDEKLRHLCLRGLQQAEVILRTQFAYVFSDTVGPHDALTKEGSFLPLGRESVTESILRDLDRSKEPFIEHHATVDKYTSKRRYDDLPVWAAVEALSFGTLSKCLEYCANPEVPRGVAAGVGVAWDGFTSQVRSFPYLRNRAAHHSRLWHHSVLDAPRVPNNVSARAKRNHGKFDPRSVFLILVALDNFLNKAGAQSGFLETVHALLDEDPLFADGIYHPQATPRRP